MTTDISPFSMVPEDLITAVSGNAIKVWCALHRFADAGGACWPAQSTIGERCGLSDRAVRRHITELVHTGRLSVIKRRGHSDLYRLRLTNDPGRNCPDTPDETVLPTPDETVRQKESQLTRTKKDKRSGAYTTDFEAWWSSYPSPIRDGKGKAALSWARLADDERLRAAVAVQVFGRIVNGAPIERQRFFKRPEAWLNQRCWETDPEVWRTNARAFGSEVAQPKIYEDKID